MTTPRQVNTRFGRSRIYSAADLQARYKNVTARTRADSASISIAALRSDQAGVIYDATTITRSDGTVIKIPEINIAGFNQDYVDAFDDLIEVFRTPSTGPGGSEYYTLLGDIAQSGWTVNIIIGKVGHIRGRDAGGITEKDPDDKQLDIVIEAVDGVSLKSPMGRLEFISRIAHELLHKAISHVTTVGGRKGDIYDLSRGIPADLHFLTRQEFNESATYGNVNKLLLAARSTLDVSEADVTKLQDRLFAQARSLYTVEYRIALAIQFRVIMKSMLSGKPYQQLTRAQLDCPDRTYGCYPFC
jgi:hypothetical protein